ncbi:anti-sigma factor [Arthrobacter sulfonylureivorans]|uniref:Anti-sigma factor n=1 Tax=Arthrobacter sulfonylureivorans TaxID=2486855 RepID=A0ABY3W9J8_9MICC|nr:anti-sigma factor [Arthrobacter sulfonylureivorans]UNK45248.1 anti-sigma factor [Arthrobacter sulfonylureivorans]
MQHLDPELISLLALDDTVGDRSDRDHLRTCSQCADEYQACRRAVNAAKADPNPQLESPGPHVWQAIHRELGLSPELAEDPLRANSGPAPVRSLPSKQTSAGRPPSRKRPARNLPAWLAAAAAVVLLAAIGVSWIVNRNVATLAQADLQPLEQYAATGTARVVETNGIRELEIRLSANEARGYQEVWLIKPDLSGLVSLGVLDSDRGRFPIPQGLDLSQFPIVDVSDEPLDGNPAHSSVSIVRGSLGT